MNEAFILHSRNYRDTSLIIDLLTRDEGRFSAVVRGARSEKSKVRGRLQPFTPLLVGTVGRGELKTCTTIDFQGRANRLEGGKLLLGLYVNELLYRLLGRFDPVTTIYDEYYRLLKAFESESDSVSHVRLFELRLLEELGYGINFEYDAARGDHIAEDRHYRYVVHEGFYESDAESASLFPGSELLKIAEHNLAQVDEKRLRNLTRISLAELLGEKPLKSRSLFKDASR